MSGVPAVLWGGVRDSFLTAWEVWWALVLGFAISAIVIAALIVDCLSSGAGLIPTLRPTRGDIFGRVAGDYKLFLSLLGLAIFLALLRLTTRPGETGPADHVQAHVHGPNAP